MRIIFLIMIGLSMLKADFSRNATGVITDSVTNLEWQDDVSAQLINWQSAIDYCEALTIDGKNDWRLPNKNELLSIVNHSVYNPSISSVFVNIISNRYWSSTTNIIFIDSGVYVNFYDGMTNNDLKTYDYYVRCVRAGL